MKINIKALMLSLGILFAIVAFLICLWFTFTGYASSLISIMTELVGGVVVMEHQVMASGMKNFLSNLSGIVFFTVFAFIDGVIFGTIFGFFYNLFLPKQKK
jgi:hypothetical protein